MRPGLGALLGCMGFMIGVATMGIPDGEARELPLETYGMLTYGGQKLMSWRGQASQTSVSTNMSRPR